MPGPLPLQAVVVVFDLLWLGVVSGVWLHRAAIGLAVLDQHGRDLTAVQGLAVDVLWGLGRKSVPMASWAAVKLSNLM